MYGADENANPLGAPPAAADIRHRAWEQLRTTDSYGTYVLGDMALTLLAILATMLLSAVFVVPYAVGASAALGVGEPDLAGLYSSSLLSSAVFVLGVLYIVGASRWSGVAMAIAEVRGGLLFAHAFSGLGNGWRMVALLLWQSTYVTFGLLLFIVPGIRAAFSYALAPYLLVDHPEWKPRKCLDESKRLMEGHRMRLFELGLSFVGWFLLVAGVGLLPFIGLFAHFFLTPYFSTSFATFYEDLLDRQETAAKPPRADDPSLPPEVV